MNPRLPQPKAILFDWDNTLVDSWACIVDAFNITLRHMGHDEWSWEESRQRISLSLRDTFPTLFGERWEEARDFYYRTFEAIHLERLTPLPGAGELLRELSGRGLYLGVVSNKTGRYLRREAAHLGWEGFFGRLVGATDACRDKPDPEPVRMALQGSGIEACRGVWFVGDAAVDVQCAANAGCTPVLIREAPPENGEFSFVPALSYCRDCDEFASLVRELSVPISGI